MDIYQLPGECFNHQAIGQSEKGPLCWCQWAGKNVSHEAWRTVGKRAYVSHWLGHSVGFLAADPCTHHLLCNFITVIRWKLNSSGSRDQYPGLFSSHLTVLTTKLQYHSPRSLVSFWTMNFVFFSAQWQSSTEGAKSIITHNRLNLLGTQLGSEAGRRAETCQGEELVLNTSCSVFGIWGLLS